MENVSVGGVTKEMDIPAGELNQKINVRRTPPQSAVISVFVILAIS